MAQLVLGMLSGLSMSAEEQIALIRRVGFDGVFTDWTEEEGLTPYLAAIRREGLFYQSVHAPFGHVHLLWEAEEEGEGELARQMRCLEDAARAEVPVVVAHTIIGMKRCTPGERGIARYGRLFDRAAELGVRLAVENTEGECYLTTLYDAFRSHPAFGFCIDTGHEMCYNERRDLISRYGDRLVATHLNDNLGRTGEEITWWDDSHLLPFDGTADWEGIARRLHGVGYRGPLTLELTRQNKPNRQTHDRYAHLYDEAFFAEAYARACRFADLMDKMAEQ